MGEPVNRISNVTLTIVTLLLGFFLAVAGANKLTPAINAGFHQEMIGIFKRLSWTFPLTVIFGIKIEPDVYRLAVGWLELVAGILLMVGPGGLKKLANIILFLTMCGAVYTHAMLGDGVDKTALSFGLAVLLLVRFLAVNYTQSSSPAARPKKIH